MAFRCESQRPRVGHRAAQTPASRGRGSVCGEMSVVAGAGKRIRTSGDLTVRGFGESMGARKKALWMGPRKGQKLVARWTQGMDPRICDPSPPTEILRGIYITRLRARTGLRSFPRGKRGSRSFGHRPGGLGGVFQSPGGAATAGEEPRRTEVAREMVRSGTTLCRAGNRGKFIAVGRRFRTG